ncbi:MAG TPA: c-type cytochrome [Rhodocyclaceae bacterium]|nr:c-type cytochrome [Rhodocyclaceae bacterium]
MNKRFASFVALISVFAVAGPALAANGEAIAKEKQCFSCHDLSAEKFGPSFKDIARRFSGLQNAKRMLVKEVQVGTHASGITTHWGNMKMNKDTDRVPVSQAEAEQLVDYILDVK